MDMPNKTPMGGGTKVLCLAIVSILAVVSSVLVLYDLNGGSLDMEDRELVLVVTGSMDVGETDFEISTIPEDSLVMVHRISGDDLLGISVGDVVAYDLGSIEVMHRVVDIDSDAKLFVLKGDANVSEEAVPFDAVTGKVVGVNHALGEVASLAKAKPVLLIMAVACLVVMLYSIREVVCFYRKEESNER